MRVDRTVDALGRPCPIPVVELARAIAEVPPGGVVELLSDDPASKVDVPVWCRLKAHELIERRDLDGGGWAYLVRRVS